MKKLQRSKSNRVFFGVCGGLAEYLDLDPVAIRLVFVLVTLFGGMSILAYIIGVIVIPESDEEPARKDPEVKETAAERSLPPETVENTGTKSTNKRDKSGEIIGIVLITFGVIFLLRKIDWMDRYFDWITYHFWSLLLPIILLILGTALIMRSKK